MDSKHNRELTPYAKALRRGMTREERHIWHDFLRTYPIRFLRQKVIDDFIVDFYCHKARLVIEIDGSQHYEEDYLKYDAYRTARIESRGLRVIRFTNSEIDKDFDGVCSTIDAIVKEALMYS